jgi:hypothetical protein
MGAEVFDTEVGPAPGKPLTAGQAFDLAVKQAQYDYGHRGYTGTIAEKDSFGLLVGTPVTRDEADAIVRAAIDGGDPRISDKWGPAGALRLEDGSYRFFGWASA